MKVIDNYFVKILPVISFAAKFKCRPIQSLKKSANNYFSCCTNEVIAFFLQEYKKNVNKTKNNKVIYQL